MIRRPPRSTLFPYTTALPILATDQLITGIRQGDIDGHVLVSSVSEDLDIPLIEVLAYRRDKNVAVKDRKSTRLNSSHSQISYAVFCFKQKNDAYHRLQTICEL